MKIVLCGGGTGGHFYPLIAIAESIHVIAKERQLVAPRLYYFAPTPYDEESLFANEIVYMPIPAGKWRRYFSFRNLTDIFKTLGGFIKAVINLFEIYPDLVISKGGFASVPVTLAARLVGIPVIIHESDSRPGRANLLASRYAYRIAISFAGAAAYFPKKVQPKIALTGIPVRRALRSPDTEIARHELGLDDTVPTLLVLGGSSGSARINETVLTALPDLLPYMNVIHQTGKAEYSVISKTATVVAKGAYEGRYHPFPFLSLDSMRSASGAATVIVSRAGATAIAELSLWRKPAILIPIPESVSHDQRTNAYTYAHTGAAVVMEEANLTPHVLASEVRRIAGDVQLAAQMGAAGAAFMPGDAARIIAEEAITIGLSHEPEAQKI